MNANPLFVNLNTFDFHLQSSSPAKDAGVTIATLTTDFDGITRPQGPAYDLGSYEYYQGSVAANPCDLNQDGVVNSADVQIAVNQSIGVSACSSADLNQDGQCNAVDVQRVVNAASGQACRVGP